MSNPNRDFSDRNYDSYCTPQTLAVFYREWNACQSVPAEDRSAAQAWTIAQSAWLRGAAYLQDVGPASVREENAQSIVDSLVDDCLCGKQFTPGADQFSGYWWQIIRNKRIDRWRQQTRRRAIERALAYHAPSAGEDPASCVVAAESLQQLPDRQRALCNLLVEFPESEAQAIETIAERYGISRRTIQRDAKALRYALDQ